MSENDIKTYFIGHRRSVALVMHHRLSGLSTYGLNGYGNGDEDPAYAPEGHGMLYLFYAQRQNATRVLAMGVCLSVTVLYCIKTVQARITKFLLSVAARTSVFLWQNLVPLGEEVLFKRGCQRRVPPLKDVDLPLLACLV